MSLGEEITSLTSPRGVISPGACIQATLTNTSCPSRLRGGKASLYELCVRRCEGGRRVKKAPCTQESKRGDGVPGKPEPRWWECPNTGGWVCQSLSPPRRVATSLRGPLRFLSITYQPGQSVVEIKQFPQSGWPLNTAGGELSQVTYLVKLEKVY